MSESTPEQPQTFSLPEWGTEGAPFVPDDLPEEEQERAPRPAPGEAALVVTTGPPTDAVVGIVVGSGEHPIEENDLAAATHRATQEAIAHLTREGRALGADAVHAVHVALTTRKDTVAAVAYGTAVRSV